MLWRKWLIRIVVAGVALFALAQVIPYGRNHTNPPVTAEPRWDSPATRQLAVRACFDCHSNLTKWMWYSNVAPVSWLVYADVSGGRSTLNFSEWDKAQDTSAGDIVEAVQGGSMPPWQYKPMHPTSQLSSSERAALVAGFVKTLAASPPLGGGAAADAGPAGCSCSRDARLSSCSLVTLAFGGSLVAWITGRPRSGRSAAAPTRIVFWRERSARPL